MDNNTTQSNKELLRDEINLVIARLDASSSNLHFSSGNGQESYSRDDMIQHVKACDDVGKRFIEEQLEFLRSFKDGSLVDLISRNL